MIVHFMQLGIDVYEYSPIELKKNISSYGKATKQLMQKTIQQIF
ncbi:crossover junction endodeoxyribonuclease RuvC [bacterium]|nr:crossover junction endodeoxyribonuclease RuvC [bacterium]